MSENKMPNNRVILIVIPLFIVVVSSMFFLTLRNRGLFKTISSLDSQNLTEVRFYKDYLRDSEGLDLPLSGTAEVKAFLEQMQQMTPSGKSVKTYTVREFTKLHFTLITGKGKKKKVEINIRRTEELGETALITLSLLVMGGSSSAGVFESDTFLAWMDGMSERKGFEKIKEYW